MTEIHNASITAAASTADLDVTALEPHGVNAEVDCQVFAKNETTGKYLEMVRLRGGQAAVIYPTTDVIKVTNIGATDGVVQVTAKA